MFILAGSYQSAGPCNSSVLAVFHLGPLRGEGPHVVYMGILLGYCDGFR